MLRWGISDQEIICGLDGIFSFPIQVANHLKQDFVNLDNTSAPATSLSTVLCHVQIFLVVLKCVSMWKSMNVSAVYLKCSVQHFLTGPTETGHRALLCTPKSLCSHPSLDGSSSHNGSDFLSLGRKTSLISIMILPWRHLALSQGVVIV